MAYISVEIPAKPGLHADDKQRCVDFATKLMQCMTYVTYNWARELSTLATHAGTSSTPKTDPATAPSLQQLSVPGNEKWRVTQAANFLKPVQKNLTAAQIAKVNSGGRMKYGYVLELDTENLFKSLFGEDYRLGKDYLYNDPNPNTTEGFPLKYTNPLQGARPDWRLKLLKSGSTEAIFDATSPGQQGHIKAKKVGTLKLADMPGVVYGAEIIYQDQDAHAYFDDSNSNVTSSVSSTAVPSVRRTAPVSTSTGSRDRSPSRPRGSLSALPPAVEDPPWYRRILQNRELQTLAAAVAVVGVAALSYLLSSNGPDQSGK